MQMCEEFHNPIVTCIGHRNKYGINHLDYLLHLKSAQGVSPLSTTRLKWDTLDHVTRCGIAATALLVAYCPEETSSSSAIDQVLNNIEKGCTWYYPTKAVHIFLDLVASLDQMTDVQAALINLAAMSPVLALWLSLDPGSLRSFLTSPHQLYQLTIHLKAGRLVQKSHGRVPYWVLQIHHKAARCDLRAMVKGFPYSSATDRRHMSTNVTSFLNSLLSTSWHDHYSAAYPSETRPSYTSTLARVNLLLDQIPIGTFQQMVLVILATLAADVNLDNPAYDYLRKYGVLSQDMHHLHVSLKSFSNCLRRCCATPDGRKIDDKLTIVYAYWEMAIGRSNMVSNWAQEIVNRTRATYHIHAKGLNTNNMPWRDSEVAYLDRDATFYDMFRAEATNIFAQLIPDRAPSESYLEFIQRRSEWMTSGSSAGESVIIDGQSVKVNKRGYAETRPAHVIANLLYTTIPEEEAVGSEKYENSKPRAIYGTKTTHYEISSYATKGFEERLHLIPGLEKGLGGAAQYGAEIKRARISGDPTQHLTMLDYSDFNIQHTPEAQAILYEVCAAIGKSRAAHNDWVAAHTWLAQSKYRVTCTFPVLGADGKPVKLVLCQGMFSGTRSTDLINTICNLIYFRIANQLVYRLFSLAPEALYHVHQGDDVWISNKSPLWAAVLYKTMNQMGFSFNKLKQMFGMGRGEFLRVLSSSGSASGYAARSLINLILRPTQNSLSLMPMEQLTSITNSLTTLSRRSFSKVSLMALHQDLTSYWGKIRSHHGDPRPLTVPKLVQWAPPAEGGMDCAPPHLAVSPMTNSISQPRLIFDCTSILEQLPGYMTSDWLAHVSRKVGKELPISTQVLNTVCKTANYLDAIRQATTLLPYKKYQQAWRAMLTKQVHLKVPPSLVSLNRVGWFADMGINNAPSRYSIINPQRRIKLPPTYQAQTIIAAIRHPELTDSIPTSLLSAVLACSASSPFKNINMTMAALGFSEIEAIQFVLNYIHNDTASTDAAKTFLSELVRISQAFPLHLLLSASHGYTGALRYSAHPAINIEVNARIKSQLLALVGLLPSHDTRDWKLLWNQRALELLQLLSETVLPSLPSVLF
jgi:hypothetical protein